MSVLMKKVGEHVLLGVFGSNADKPGMSFADSREGSGRTALARVVLAVKSCRVSRVWSLMAGLLVLVLAACVEPVVPLSFSDVPDPAYFHLEGKADDGTAVRLELQRSGADLRGWAWYGPNGAPVRVSGTLGAEGAELAEESVSFAGYGAEPVGDGALRLTGTFGRVGKTLVLGLTRFGIDGPLFTVKLVETYKSAARFGLTSHSVEETLVDGVEGAPTASWSSADVSPAEGTKGGLPEACAASFFGSASPAEHYGFASQEYFNRWRSEVESLYQPGDDAFGLSWSEASVSEIMYNGPRYVVIRTDGYDYTGGAHGMPWISYFVWDQKRQARLTTAEVFQMEKADELAALLTDVAREQAGLEPGVSLVEAGFFEETLPFHEGLEWFLTPAGVGITFMAYEVAPYAAGLPTIFIPMDRVAPFLQQGFGGK